MPTHTHADGHTHDTHAHDGHTHDTHAHDGHTHDTHADDGHTHDAHGHTHVHVDDTKVPRRERIGPLRVGIGGPVGSGKTALVIALSRTLSKHHEVAVVTNDIYTKEDAEKVRASGALPVERVVAVETGCCPHTAIRDDITANAEAIEDLVDRIAGLDIVLLESGGDNLTATFSPALVDVQLFVIDVAGGDKVPRKGGPGVTRSDLLVINKTDLARYVGADLDVMRRDAMLMRGERPTLFTSLVDDPDATDVAAFLVAAL